VSHPVCIVSDIVNCWLLITLDRLEIIKRPCIPFDVVPLQMPKLMVIFRVASAYNICGPCFLDMDPPTSHSKRTIFILWVTIIRVDLFFIHGRTIGMYSHDHSCKKS
jgi:hypothetical protein